MKENENEGRLRNRQERNALSSRQVSSAMDTVEVALRTMAHARHATRVNSRPLASLMTARETRREPTRRLRTNDAVIYRRLAARNERQQVNWCLSISSLSHAKKRVAMAWHASSEKELQQMLDWGQ